MRNIITAILLAAVLSGCASLFTGQVGSQIQSRWEIGPTLGTDDIRWEVRSTDDVMKACNFAHAYSFSACATIIRNEGNPYCVIIANVSPEEAADPLRFKSMHGQSPFEHELEHCRYGLVHPIRKPGLSDEEHGMTLEQAKSKVKLLRALRERLLDFRPNPAYQFAPAK